MVRTRKALKRRPSFQGVIAPNPEANNVLPVPNVHIININPPQMPVRIQVDTRLSRTILMTSSVVLRLLAAISVLHILLYSQDLYLLPTLAIFGVLIYHSHSITRYLNSYVSMYVFSYIYHPLMCKYDMYYANPLNTCGLNTRITFHSGLVFCMFLCGVINAIDRRR